MKDKYQSVFTMSARERGAGRWTWPRWRQDRQRKSALRALFKKDPIKRMSGAAEMVRRWKQEYRMMV